MARHLPGLATGAFLLFLANFTAIALGAMTIFWLTGHRPPVADGARKVFVPRLFSLLLFVVLGLHLTISFHHTIMQAVLESDIRKTLSTQLANIPGARLDSVSVVSQQGRPAVWAVVRSPQPISPEQVGQLSQLINRATGSVVSLRVRSVITAETSAGGYIYEPQLPPTEDSHIPPP
jgi:uncharacterized membrane protein